jgi:repressor LexA
MTGLSPRQKEVLAYIIDYHQQRGYAPTFREIARATTLSLSSAMAHIQALRGKGYIAWDEGTARSIHIVK